MGQAKSPAEQLADFLNFIDSCIREYHFASGAVNDEDKRLMDLVHAMEFAADKAERNRIATKLQRSRKIRRENKDTVMRDKLIVEFFQESANKRVLNQLRQLMGRQRKEEEFLASERVYKPRMKGE